MRPYKVPLEVIDETHSSLADCYESTEELTGTARHLDTYRLGYAICERLERLLELLEDSRVE